MIRLIKFGVVLAILLIIATIAIPNLLSTSYVKERIERQLSEITGRSVSLNGGSSISLRPYLSVSYDNVSIGEETPSSRPVIQMDSLRAKLGILSALWGDAQLAELELVRPRFNLQVSANGEANWKINRGPLAKRLKLKQNETLEPLSLGKIKIIDGIAKINNELQRNTQELTGINGTLTWVDVTSAGAIDLSAVWQGENIELVATLGSPFELLRGGPSAVEADMTSKPLSFTYSGNLDTKAGIAKGNIIASSPSVRRLTEWFGFPISATNSLGATSLEGSLIATTTSLELPEAEVRVGEHTGNGRLQLTRDDNSTPALTGTLAFDTIILPGLTQISTATGNNNFDFLKGFNLDLRLSANTATSAPIEFENLAAAVIVREEKASFDIGYADTLGGTLSGSITLQTENNEGQFSTNMALKKINLDELAKLYGDTSITLNGKGNANLKLKSSGKGDDIFLKRLNGEGSIQGANGSIIGIDLPKLFAAARENKQAVRRLIDGTTDYEQLKIDFYIANGTAFLRGTQMQGDEIIVSIGGQSDLTQRSLALRGQIHAKDDGGNPDPDKRMSFFVGGTTSAPLIIPLPNQ
ncbi:MAG: AsmA family protein [Rhizobiaceae bacterium]